MIDGFFSTQETSLKNKRMASGPECGRCPLKTRTKRSPVKVKGLGEKKIAVVIDGYAIHDKELFKKLDMVLRKYAKVNPTRDCWFIPVTRCACSIEKSTQGAHSCRPHVHGLLNEYKPDLILCFGINAVNSVIGHKWKKGMDTIEKWRGYFIPDRDYGCHICPLLSIDMIKDKDAYRGVGKVIMESDLKQAMEHLNAPFYNGMDFKDENECIHILNEFQGLEFMRDLNENFEGLIAFDYETNCLKPYSKKAKLWSVGIATSPNHAVAFLVKSRETKKELRELLRNTNIRKIAANMKFEEIWTRTKLKTKVLRWCYDTVLGAHIEDQRGGGHGKSEDRSSGTTSVKFQSCVKLGIYDYDSTIHPFLVSKGKGGNSLNTIDKAPKKDLLRYNAMDGLVEYRLALLGAELIGVKL